MTLIRVDFREDEDVETAVINRLREEFGRSGGLSLSAVGRLIGMPQSRLSDRMHLKVPFRLGEIAAICDAIGSSFDYVMTGIKEVPDQSSHPRGGVVRPYGTATEPRTGNGTDNQTKPRRASRRPTGRTPGSPRNRAITAAYSDESCGWSNAA